MIKPLRWLALFLFLLGGSAFGQSAVQVFTGSPTAPVSGTNPLAVNASVTANTSATASSTPTAVSAGPGVSLNVDLHSALFEQPVFGGTPVDGTHGLPVNCILGCAGGTTSNASSGVATSSTNGATVGWLYGFNGTSWDQLQVDGSKNLKTTLPTNQSVNAAQFGGNNVVTGTGTGGNGIPRVTVSSDSSLTGLAAGVTTSGTTGSGVMGAVTTSGPTYTTGQTNWLSLDTAGNLRTALAANQSVNVAQIGGTNTVNGGLAGSLSVGGTVATNVAITANPLNLGAQAVSSENPAVTTARQVQLVADLVGKLIVLPYANPENFVSGVTAAMTATTSTSLIAAPASGLRNYITQCTFSNSHATVGTMMNLQDGSGGTTIYSFPAAPAYGGAIVSFPTPLRQPTTATALFVVNATTGSNTFAACSGYKGA